jgi:hypothetical protein
VDAELAAHAVLGRADLAVDGRDLIAELGLRPGREVGRLLDELTESVVAEPALNDRAILLELARHRLGGKGD